MAKKGGKKKGGKGGKGKKKAGKGENEMTLKEAMLAFQIQVKEKAAEELRFEITGLKEKNKRYQARNNQLKEEQVIHIKTLLRQAKEQEKELEEQEVYNSEHVEQSLREKWDVARKEEQSLDDLRVKIAEIDKKYSAVNSNLEFWNSYRDVGAQEHKQQIELLENELQDMKQGFDDMCAHLKWQLDTAKSEVKEFTESCMAEQKHLASEKAMSQLDPASVQEVHENEWLKQEAEIYRKDVKNMLAHLDDLERENLEIISELLDCRQEDLKISRRFYLTQFTEEEILDNDTMHDMDLKEMSVYQKGYQSPAVSTPLEERPKSAMLQAIEDKVFSITLPEDDEESDDDDDDDDDVEDDGGTGDRGVEGDMIAHQDEDINIEDDMDFIHLGPLEINLLCVKGESKPIYKMDASLEIKDGTRGDITVTRPRWPIATPMIRAALEASGTAAATSGRMSSPKKVAASE